MDATLWPEGQFTPEQIALLEADRNLVVERVEISGEEPRVSADPDSPIPGTVEEAGASGEEPQQPQQQPQPEISDDEEPQQPARPAGGKKGREAAP